MQLILISEISMCWASWLSISSCRGILALPQALL